jgi:hypothetical protein
MTHKAVFLALAAVGIVAACTDTRRTLGDDCLKNEDCVSGLCTQFVCSTHSVLTDAALDNPDAEPVADTGPAGEAAAEGGAAEAAVEAAAETGGGDAAADGAAD